MWRSLVSPRNWAALVLMTALWMFPCFSGAVTILTTGGPGEPVCCFGNELDSFGRSNLRTLGQTFTTPHTDTLLTSFSFWQGDWGSEGAGLRFRAYIVDWDATVAFRHPGIAVGPILFESDVSFGSTSEALEKVTFEIPGGLPLTPGNDYVAFVSTLDFQAGDSRNTLGYFRVDALPGGEWVAYQGNADQSGPLRELLSVTDNVCFPGNPSKPCWLNGSPTDLEDMAFEAVLVAEPGSLGLLGAAILGLLWLRRNRNRLPDAGERSRSSPVM